MMRSRSAKFGNYTRVGCLVLLCAVLSPVMLYLGFASLRNEHNLQDHGVAVEAVVTEWQADQNNYRVRYKFRVKGDNTWYSCSDATGRRDIWCPISEEEWTDSRSTGRIWVAYLPENPWVNRPVYTSVGTSDSWIGICMGVAPWSLALTYILSRKRNRWQHTGT